MPSQQLLDRLAQPGTNLRTRARVATGLETLETEIAAEQVSSLGRAGKAVESAMNALAAHPIEGEDRPALLKAAARAVHHYFIQRELCGLRRHDDAIRHYAISREVLARLGAQ